MRNIVNRLLQDLRTGKILVKVFQVPLSPPKTSAGFDLVSRFVAHYKIVLDIDIDS